jgi:predicted nucleic acid-binding protein
MISSPLIDSKIPRRPRIYLDLCVIQRPSDDLDQLRVSLEAEAVLGIVALVQQGDVELVSSTALVIENEANSRPRRQALTKQTLALADEVIQITEVVERRAERYRELGLKPMDATHLASAVEAGVDFFCTCDDRLLRRARTVETASTRAVSPLELIQEIER